MEEQESSNPDQVALEGLLSKVFVNLASLKTSYIHLHAGVTSDADKVSELKQHSFNPSPQASRLAVIQHQQSLLKAYEVMVKDFQTKIQYNDSEIVQLQQKIEQVYGKKAKLENKLKHRVKKSSYDGYYPANLTPELFVSTINTASKAIRHFSKPLIKMMKAAGWDLDDAASRIESDVVYAKRDHTKYAFEANLSQGMLIGFEKKSYCIKSECIDRESFFRQYLAMREMDPLDIISQYPDSAFGNFCRLKYLLVVPPMMESSFFGNSDQRNIIELGGHPRTSFYKTFLKLAKSIWLLHRLAYSFEPNVIVFQVNNGSGFSELYMENVVDDMVMDESVKEKSKVGVMVMPGFWVAGELIRSRVYLSVQDES